MSAIRHRQQLLPTLHAYRERILPLRRQAEITNRWLRQRLDSYLPELMAREGIDVWVINTREYNEDPVLLSLLPAPCMSARRRTILLFTLQPDGCVERLAVTRYGIADLYEGVWDPAVEEQYACLARLLAARNPWRIGLNYGPDFAFGDGLSHTDYAELAAALGPDLMARTCSAERLCVGWLEHRLPEELVVYPALAEMGHALIAEAFSSRVVQPGITTTDDVVWWMMQRMSDLNLEPWFPPTIELQAKGMGANTDFSAAHPQREVIMPGDVLHCDVGFRYLGLCTDQQELAYVLHPGEGEAPEGLQAALAQGNRQQDHLLAAMRPGRTGNEVLAESLRLGRADGLVPQVYTHPLGYHGHGAGPTIGLWDMQDGVPGRGDYPLYDDTAYSIELNVWAPVPEWGGQPLLVALEEDAMLTQGAMQWLDGRQEAFHLIG